MSETLGEGRFLRLVRRNGWEFVQRIGVDGVVAIVAVTGDRELVVVEQERPAVGRTVLDLPAGLAGDVQGEDSLEAAARRELEEETGFVAAGWERVADTPPSPGLSSEVVTYYRATGLQRVGAGGGVGSERITVHLVPLTGIAAWLEERAAAGDLIDLKLYAGLHFIS
jgi:ADP-ribose pyrophosphatase